MGDNKVYLLIGFEQYYPSPDNTIRVFKDEQRARKICEELQSIHGKPDYKERYNELREKYGWLPEYSHEIYIVNEHKVDNE